MSGHRTKLPSVAARAKETTRASGQGTRRSSLPNHRTMRATPKGSCQDIGQGSRRSPRARRKRWRREAKPLGDPICRRWVIQPLGAEVCCFKPSARRSFSIADGVGGSRVSAMPRPCASSRRRSSQSSSRAARTASRSAPRSANRPARSVRPVISWRTSARKAVEPRLHARLNCENPSSRAAGSSSTQTGSS
jgi:hypothetical protein